MYISDPMSQRRSSRKAKLYDIDFGSNIFEQSKQFLQKDFHLLKGKGNAESLDKFQKEFLRNILIEAKVVQPNCNFIIDKPPKNTEELVLIHFPVEFEKFGSIGSSYHYDVFDGNGPMLKWELRADKKVHIEIMTKLSEFFAENKIDAKYLDCVDELFCDKIYFDYEANGSDFHKLKKELNFFHKDYLVNLPRDLSKAIFDHGNNYLEKLEQLITSCLPYPCRVNNDHLEVSTKEGIVEIDLIELRSTSYGRTLSDGSVIGNISRLEKHFDVLVRGKGSKSICQTLINYLQDFEYSDECVHSNKNESVTSLERERCNS